VCGYMFIHMCSSIRIRMCVSICLHMCVYICVSEYAYTCVYMWIYVDWCCSYYFIRNSPWQFPEKMLHPRNPPSRETQIPWYLSWYKSILKFCSGTRRRKGVSPAAAARHQGRSQGMRGEIRGFIYPGSIYTGETNLGTKFREFIDHLGV